MAARFLLPLLLLALCLLLAPSTAQGQQTGFLAGISGDPAAAEQQPQQAAGGSSCNSGGARFLIAAVTPVPGASGAASVILRNAGGAEGSLSDVVLVDQAGAEHRFDADACESRLGVFAGGSRAFSPGECGLGLTLGETGSLSLKGGNVADASTASWTNAPPGAQLVLTGDGSYKAFPGTTTDVLGVLRAAGNFRTFLAALEATGVAAELAAQADPAYIPPNPDAEAAEEAAAQELAFPSWFAAQQGANAPPPAARPPRIGEEGGPIPAVGVPPSGPFTLFAPDDAAFDALLTQLGTNGRRLPRDALLRRPELRSIVEYHVVPGLYNTSAMRNNTPVWTARGVEVVPFAGDPCAAGGATAGRLTLSDQCLNKPTPDQYTCAEQKAFDKCDFPFMSSALAAQWQGGFCGRACERCSCSPADGGAPCAEVALPDLAASNGVVHGITRVLLPPPRFTKEAALEQAALYNATVVGGVQGGAVMGGGVGGVGADPTTGALVLPGTAAAAPPGLGTGAAMGADPMGAAVAPADPAAAPTAPPQPSLLLGAGRRLRRRV
jgi:hypothetical protein